MLCAIDMACFKFFLRPHIDYGFFPEVEIQLKLFGINTDDHIYAAAIVTPCGIASFKITCNIVKTQCLQTLYAGSRIIGH